MSGATAGVVEDPSSFEQFVEPSRHGVQIFVIPNEEDIFKTKFAESHSGSRKALTTRASGRIAPGAQWWKCC